MHHVSKYHQVSSAERGAQRKCARHSVFKPRFAICAIIIFALIAFPLVALQKPAKAVAGGARSDNITVTAGIFNFEGYHMKDDEGRLTGYGISFLNLVSEYSRLNFDYTGYDHSWGDMLTMLQNGDIDVVTSASKTPEREELFAFSLPIGRRKTVLSIRVDNTERQRGDYDTYNGMKVGVVANSSQNAEFEQFQADKGFTCVMVAYEDSDKLAEDLQNGTIDAILSSNLRKAENEKTLDIIEEADFYAIVRKDDAGLELLKEINYAIEQMNINEGDWQNVLFYQYYGPSYDSSFSFTERELEYIDKVISGEKTITATAFGGRMPYSYVEDGKLKGIMLDYFEEVMKLAGLPYNIIVPKDTDNYNELVGKNGVNVVIDSTGTDDVVEDSSYGGFYTDSYMTASLARVTRQDNPDNIKTIAVPDLLVEPLEKHGVLDGYKIVRYSGGEAAVRAVLNKKADAAYAFAYTAQVFINRDHNNTLYYNIMDGTSMTFSMRISEDTDHELITILNKCIKRASDDTINRLASEYLAFSIAEMTFWQFLQANPGLIIAVVLVFAAIISVIIMMYLRGRWNKKLLKTTEQANKEMGEQLAIVKALSRDYTNVYAVDDEHATARIIKLQGYVTEGLQKDSVEMFDYSAVLDTYINSRVHPEDRPELTRALSLDNVREQLRDTDEFSGIYRILENGKVHHYQFTYIKITEDKPNQSAFILAGFRNIDEMIRKEQEQKDALAEALAQAQYANKAKTTFLNNMSHDIRTPMNAIIGFTSLAATHLDNKDQIRDYLGKIMTSGNHLLSLINDVLDMSRIESGKVKIEEKETSLPEIMHDLKTIVQADVKSKQLEFYIDTLDVTNETIICDKLRLSQVLLNLLSNAMKYTKPGGMVSVRVIQTADAPDGYASYKFCVKDTGIGMSSEFLEHVFEPFTREQTTTVSGIQGTGLGLAITKNIVDMMNGTITVESEVGKGSEFTVTFCFRVTEASPEEQKLQQLENLRALVVDDDVNTCVSVSKMLSTIGMRPDWTTLGNEAVIRTQFAKDQNEPYSAYIIDWLMPDMNGIELVRRIRKVINDMTPIIVLTAYDWADIEQEAREAGVTAFCSKPIFLSELRSVLAAPFAEEKQADDVPTEPETRFVGKKLLLVEDNELNMEIAQTILESAGFVVDTADDGSVAVELMKKKPAGTYDLILMDVQMPIMNGYDATRAIRAMKSRKKANIPIVAMTANAFDEDKKEAFDAGMNGYASKPIEIDKLMKTIEDLLK